MDRASGFPNGTRTSGTSTDIQVPLDIELGAGDRMLHPGVPHPFERWSTQQPSDSTREYE
jgi:hypothetical protein